MKELFSFRKSALFVLYVLGFIFALRSALPSYINSSFLSSLSGEKLIGTVYIVCSILTLVLFIFIPNILKRYGNYNTTVVLSVVNLVTLLGLAFFNNVVVLLVCFIVTYITTTILAFCLDIFIEHNSSDTETGKIRSYYLTSVNLAWLISPWLSGLLIGNNAFWKVYLVSTAIMIPIVLLISYNLKKFADPEYKEFHIIKTFKEVWVKKDIRCILASSFFLQFFFAWMVIYTPIYLNEYIGFDWKTIGIIFTIMLLPFVLIQIPLGKLADKRYGEKEMLTVGFIILSVSSFLIPLVDGKSLWIWALLLFLTRLGAATVEIMTDVYFFKNVSEKNINLISLYRTTGPLAYIVAPAIATIFLIFFPFVSLFYVLGFLMLFSLRYTLAIRDTK